MNNLFRKIALSVMTAILIESAFAVLPSIKNVSARQRHPWNGKVDIEYEVVGDIMTGLLYWQRILKTVMSIPRPS